MTYRVVLSRQARKYYCAAPAEIARRLARVFESLESTSHPVGSEALKSKLQGFLGIKAGSPRVIDRIEKDAGIIRIVPLRPAEYLLTPGRQPRR